ncbi:MAG: hypothetical protein F4Y92_06965 [Dehalococcoidia bacterium]|nr:hypothetical protein [Dehalococcoidia bacterium]
MDNARLRLQTLARQPDQVLVVAHVTALRSGELHFTHSAVADTYAQLRIPPPSNLGSVLSRLGKRSLLVRSGSSHWALTPIGDARVAELGVSLGAADFQTEYASELGANVHHTIGAEFAPLPLTGPIGAFLGDHPFDRNVFGITRYPEGEASADPLTPALDVAGTTLRKYSLDFHLASDRNVADELWPNVAASMWACRYGIAFIEARVEADVNRNVLIEVGAMLMTGRRCVLLRDRTVEKMPTDLVGHIYKPIDLDDMATVEAALRDWCEADLQLG